MAKDEQKKKKRSIVSQNAGNPEDPIITQQNSLPRQLSLKAWQITVAIIMAVGGLGTLTSACWKVFSYARKVHDLETQSENLSQQITKETNLRKVHWYDHYVVKRDSTHSRFDSVLEYDAKSDTLQYARKKRH